MIQYRCLNPRVVAVQEEVQRVEDYISLMSLRFNVPTPLAGRPDDHEPGPDAPGEEPKTPPADRRPFTLPRQGQKSDPGPQPTSNGGGGIIRLERLVWTSQPSLSAMLVLTSHILQAS